MNIHKVLLTAILILFPTLTAAGCKTQTCVVVNTETAIGIVAVYQPELNLPTGKLGFARSETVLVPTNRISDTTSNKALGLAGVIGQGARDCANVITEINFVNFFAFWRSNGIYQRIAVGEVAVSQPGASMMFAKDEAGQISQAAADAIKSLSSGSGSTAETAVQDERVSLKTQLIKLCQNEAVKTAVIEYLKTKNITWDSFIDDTVKVTVAEIKDLLAKVQK